MLIIESIQEMQKALEPLRAAGKSVGLVPTMGYLHAGHMSLVTRARAENDIVVMSIFVNPTQFGADEDFEGYPRDLARDAGLAEQAGADFIFAPEADEMYPDGYGTFVEVDGPETQGMCAAGRPGHFRGVATVVEKLLDIVEPDRAYFGQKDAQQLAVVKKMVKDLNLSVAIVGCPIVRDPDGLAMSSRNVYLRPDERQAAPVVYKSLKRGAELVKQGERSSVRIIDTVKRLINGEPLGDLEYVEIRELTGFTEPEMVSGEVMIAAAVRFGRARLIDNVLVNNGSDGSE
jgi:pantoate--beta-alanine ligase